MSADFFTAHLRVPRGLGAVIEGLAREVLRDQPENIPEYAANYFNPFIFLFHELKPHSTR
uniref:RIIa domain-containing protein n=1 Tax=Oryzias melastigma TaxID=30732 RepID=A0A3B3DMZ8_ORYME